VAQRSIFFLLLGFASLCAALPSVRVIHETDNEFNIKAASRDQRLLLFSIDNPDSSRFSLKMQFTNKCYFKRLNRISGTPFPLSILRMRYTQPYRSENPIDIWYRTSPVDCDYFILNFKEDIKDYYEIELLGSWGDGGYKLAPGTYGERIILTILPLQSSL